VPKDFYLSKRHVLSGDEPLAREPALFTDYDAGECREPFLLT
jgi:hypothetical protein